MKTKATRRAMPSAREIVPGPEAQNLILEAVDELFYQEGARAVGVDAVVKRAGVNKMSLYRQFESKDGLLLHYLERREARFWGYIEASIAKHPDAPKQQLQQIFTDVAQRARVADYRGCPFVNIAVEFPERGHPARTAVAANKSELMARLLELARQSGAEEPRLLAHGLALLLEGAYAASQTYHPNGPLLAALPKVAQTLINAACGKGRA